MRGSLAFSRHIPASVRSRRRAVAVEILIGPGGRLDTPADAPDLCRAWDGIPEDLFKPRYLKFVDGTDPS